MRMCHFKELFPFHGSAPRIEQFVVGTCHERGESVARVPHHPRVRIAPRGTPW